MTQLINEWTRELRYQPYDSWHTDYTQQLKNTVKKAPWRLDYHVQPNTGLLNDPNGFSYFNNKWHLFYQYYPFGPVHGLKSWYHLTSDNLIDWVNEGVAIEPTNQFDSHGVYSGTALPIDDSLFLAYSGNVRDENWQRKSYQLGAKMSKEGHMQKLEHPLIDFPIKGYTDHVRDPQIIPYEEGYLMILGAQDTNEKGQVILFQSENLTNWEFIGNLDYADEEMGFMVECPNLLFIEEKPLLIFCPQGLNKNVLPYDNIYPNTYILGSDFDLKTVTIKDATPLQQLDYGFDVYATQAFTNNNNRHLSVSWVGLPEVDYPSFKDGWAHCLSLVKELTIRNGKLHQFPIAETKELRQDKQLIEGTLSSENQILTQPKNNSYELNLSFDANSSGVIHLMRDESLDKSFKLTFDTKLGKLIVDRGQVGVPFAEAFGTTRELELTKYSSLELDIFVDQSIIEIFVNKGSEVITSRVFPNSNQTNLKIEGQGGSYFGTMYSLRKMKN
ncbi:sucrose-6-phosphate hydrolase [Vagococcus hydrophili]|uniref:sucrose-6-phosphate hydrolase n=1 Tax=Vagococcus hydrophili TaxID=2714947 RepID=UPI001932AD34|nr:sucrose-6-phosphate hydrolase [Vagococcus hydrophili]